jgi:NADPH2:quinone reductase
MDQPGVLPFDIRLTSYAGEASDLPAAALAHYLGAIEAGTLEIVVADVHYGLEEVATAQRALDGSRRPGKHVVVLASS